MIEGRKLLFNSKKKSRFVEMWKILQRIVECASIKNFEVYETNRLWLRRGYKTKPKIVERKVKLLHPYKNLHPWKSIDEFTEDLIKNIIHNQDGIVVLNKPYGISNNPQIPKVTIPEWSLPIEIPYSVDYTLSDALPDISKKLGYGELSIVKSPERYTTGITILAHDENKAKAVKKSLIHSQSNKEFCKKYWIVTTRFPKCDKGQLHLGITKKMSPCQTYKQPVILTSWGVNQVKRHEVIVFDVSYRTISKAPANLSSLMEIQCFVTKSHAIRVFASTVLISPVLGDNIHGSRVKNVMGTWMNISPFVDAARELPILNPKLLEKLKLATTQRVIIPTHIHLREMTLKSFLPCGKDLKLVAPLPPAFKWTCDQLQLKIPNENRKNENDELSQISITASQ